jgi:hypothetical protein
MLTGPNGAAITGVRVTKPNGKSYIYYYRCTIYNTKGHPRHRVSERAIDEQFVTLFRRIRQPDEVRHYIR